MTMVIFNFRRCYRGEWRHYRINTYLLQLCQFCFGISGQSIPDIYRQISKCSDGMGWDGIFCFVFGSVFLLLFSISFFITSTMFDMMYELFLTAFWNWVLGRWRPGCVVRITCFFIMRWR